MEKKFIIEKVRQLSLLTELHTLSNPEICERLGVDINLFEEHFKSREILIEEILKRERSSFEQIFLENDFSDSNAIDILFVVSREIFKRFSMVKPLVNQSYREVYSNVFQEHMEDRMKYIFEKIKINLDKGIRQGMYRSDLSIELVARLYISRLIDIHKPEFFPPEQFSFQMLFEVMFENFVRSVGTLEGIRYFELRKAETTFLL
ncbi:MAG: hypothetical protein LWX70_08755 [Sphingobacteriia bacterium]|mgnify:CR=1 FL=1|nr:hypothetical protein [Sphingobacteriia bacterium]